MAAAAVRYYGARQGKAAPEWFTKLAEERDGLEAPRCVTPQTDERWRASTIFPPSQNPVRRLKVRSSFDTRRQVPPLRDDRTELVLPVTKHDLLEPGCGHVIGTR